jgi:hypothetical protein
MTLIALLLAVAAPPSLPTVPPSPPATALMVDAVTAHRTLLLSEWLEELNGPYREARPIRQGEPRIVAPPGGDTRMGSDVEQWRPLVEAWFGANTDAALRVMRCESGGNASAYNPSGASGLFQHMARYWPDRAAAAGFAGADIFDPVANVGVAAWLSSAGTDFSHWVCRP